VQARAEDDPAQPGTCTNASVTDGLLTTDANGWAEYTGLCITTEDDGAIRYRLIEVEPREGYNLLPGPAFDGTLETEAEVELTVVNTLIFQMPATGSDGFAGAGIGLGLCLLASVLLLLFLPKKREDMNNG
jgi:LPXTG-motif cell wall-anchored protein